MTNEMDLRHQEAVVLTRAVENVFRKLIRFMIGKISLVKLQEIIRLIFIEEIEIRLKEENPKKNIALTQLALLSGLDTRTLTKVRNSKSYKQPLHQERQLLEHFTPGASILDTWSSKPPYVDEKSGAPNPLPITGKISFESLFNESMKSRGVTYKSLLKRLIQSKSISFNEETNEVSLEISSYLPSNSDDELGAIEMGFSAIGNMIDTVTRNIDSIKSGKERFYQRGAWTYRLSVKNKSKLRPKLRKLLQETDIKAREIIKEHEDKVNHPEIVTAGVSLFYFEEEGNK